MSFEKRKTKNLKQKASHDLCIKDYRQWVMGNRLRVKSVFLLVLLMALTSTLNTPSWAIQNSVEKHKGQGVPVMSEAKTDMSKLNGEVDFVSSVIKMIASLALVLAGILASYWVVKRFILKSGGGFGGRNLIQTLATGYLGQKKNITLVEVAGEVLVLGITNNNISLLSKIQDKEKIEEIHSTHGFKRNSPSFESQLKKVSSKMKEGKGRDILSEFTESIQDKVSRLKDLSRHKG